MIECIDAYRDCFGGEAICCTFMQTAGWDSGRGSERTVDETRCHPRPERGGAHRLRRFGLMFLLVALIWSIVTSAAHAPHQVWVADITDMSSRTIVGAATRASIRTDALSLAGV